GALPRADGVLVVTSRMRRILAVDIPNRRAMVEPGVGNLAVTRAAAPDGYYYAPDPSSQQICSIGGNAAADAGGGPCLKYGVAGSHLLGPEVVPPDGEIVPLEGNAPGYDLVGAFVGSEGRLGIATQLTVGLRRAAEAVRTMLAAFDTVDAAGACVSAIVAEIGRASCRERVEVRAGARARDSRRREPRE